MGGLRARDADHLRDVGGRDRSRSPGFPPFAGFFSKDEILWHAFASAHSGSPLLGSRRCDRAPDGLLHVPAVFLTFFGRRDDAEARAPRHESPRVDDRRH